MKTEHRELPAIIVLTVGALYHLLYFASADPRVLMLRTPDDAAYFSEIAWRAAHGQGFTFDGLHATNGFQPLWQWMLVPLAALAQDPLTLFRSAILLQCVLAGLAGLLLLQWSARALSPRSLAILALAYVVLVYRYALNGMETAVELLVLASLAAFASGTRAFEAKRPLASLGLGALLGVAFLARLDLVFLGGVIVVVSAWRAWREGARRMEHIQRALLVTLGASVIVAPYLLSNLREFGHVVPISGALKSSFPRIVTDKPLLERLSPKDVIQLVFVGAWCAWAARVPPPADPAQRERRAFLRAAAAAMTLHGLHTILFMKWAVFPWHFLWYGLLVVSVIADLTEGLLQRLPQRAQGWTRAAFAGLVLCAAVGFWRLDGVRSRARLERNWRVIAYETGLWAHDHTAPGTVFALADAGLFALFGQRPVVNLDGLVNDFDYQEWLRVGHLAEYLDKNHVRYVVKLHLDQTLADHYDSTAFVARSRLYDRDDSVRVWRSDELFRSRSFFHNGGDGVLVIWKWRGAGRAKIESTSAAIAH